MSLKFYEKFGEDIAKELVDWFNMVDATYRSELRELNELNYARFDAKLEQRVAELRAEMQLGFKNADVKLEQLRAEMQLGFKNGDAEMQLGFKNVDVKLERLETRLTKRLFGFWIAQAATTAGLVFGVVKLLG